MYDKGFIINNRTNEKWEFQYNPESVSFGRSANYSESTSPGSPYPTIQYTNGGSSEISVNAIVRTEGREKSPELFNGFLDSLLPNKNTDATTDSYFVPATCFVYLSPLKHLNFNAVLTGYDFSSDSLSGNLMPLTATYTLKFKEVQW